MKAEIDARIEQLRTLKPGWLDGEGQALNPAGLDWLADILAGWGGPPPHLYPTPEGGVSLEWTLEDWEVIATVDLDQRQIRLLALHTKSGQELRAGWNGHQAPAPNAKAVDSARHVVALAISALLPPDRIMASAEGGVALFWFSAETLAGGAHRRYSWIECDNEGDLTVIHCDRLGGEPTGEEMTREEGARVLGEIRAFVCGAAGDG